MAVTANSAVLAQTPRSAQSVQSLTANTNYTTSPTNTVLLYTAGSNGGIVSKLKANPTATVTATQLQLFRCTDGVGTVKNFAGAVVGSAYTMATTTAPTASDFGFTASAPMVLQANERIYVAAAVTGSWAFDLEGADF